MLFFEVLLLFLTMFSVAAFWFSYRKHFVLFRKFLRFSGYFVCFFMCFHALNKIPSTQINTL